MQHRSTVKSRSGTCECGHGSCSDTHHFAHASTFADISTRPRFCFAALFPAIVYPCRAFSIACRRRLHFHSFLTDSLLARSNLSVSPSSVIVLTSRTSLTRVESARLAFTFWWDVSHTTDMDKTFHHVSCVKDDIPVQRSPLQHIKTAHFRCRALVLVPHPSLPHWCRALRPAATCQCHELHPRGLAP